MEGVWHGDRVKARLEHSTNTGKGANHPIQQEESSKRIRDGLQPPPSPSKLTQNIKKNSKLLG